MLALPANNYVLPEVPPPYFSGLHQFFRWRHRGGGEKTPAWDPYRVVRPLWARLVVPPPMMAAGLISAPP